MMLTGKTNIVERVANLCIFYATPNTRITTCKTLFNCLVPLGALRLR